MVYNAALAFVPRESLAWLAIAMRICIYIVTSPWHLVPWLVTLRVTDRYMGKIVASPFHSFPT